jgi:hypothetical protein
MTPPSGWLDKYFKSIYDFRSIHLPTGLSGGLRGGYPDKGNLPDLLPVLSHARIPDRGLSPLGRNTLKDPFLIRQLFSREFEESTLSEGFLPDWRSPL